MPYYKYVKNRIKTGQQDDNKRKKKPKNIKLMQEPYLRSCEVQYITFLLFGCENALTEEHCALIWSRMGLQQHTSQLSRSSQDSPILTPHPLSHLDRACPLLLLSLLFSQPRGQSCNFLDVPPPIKVYLQNPIPILKCLHLLRTLPSSTLHMASFATLVIANRDTLILQ